MSFELLLHNQINLQLLNQTESTPNWLELNHENNYLMWRCLSLNQICESDKLWNFHNWILHDWFSAWEIILGHWFILVTDILWWLEITIWLLSNFISCWSPIQVHYCLSYWQQIWFYDILCILYYLNNVNLSPPPLQLITVRMFLQWVCDKFILVF